jgi:hypothetical protein
VYSVSWGSDEVTSTGLQWGDTASTESQLAKVAARGISTLVASGWSNSRLLLLLDAIDFDGNR